MEGTNIDQGNEPMGDLSPIEARTFSRGVRRLVAFAPFFAAYFILYGAIDLLTFYGKFSIDIVHYVGLSEIVSYFVKDILLIVSVLGVASFGLAYAARVSKGEVIRLESPRNTIIGSAVLSILIAVVFSYMGAWFFFVFWLLPFPVYFVLEQIYGHNWNTFKIFVVVNCLTFFLAFDHMNAARRAESILDGEDFGIEIKVDDKVLRSDSTGCFIGKTERFVFYYDRLNSRTVVYPAERVQYIIIPRRGENYIKDVLERGTR